MIQDQIERGGCVIDNRYSETLMFEAGSNRISYVLRIFNDNDASHTVANVRRDRFCIYCCYHTECLITCPRDI